jgi:aspartyl/asparaginyl beta-hydroxylase (cupin superfamily)
MKVSFQVLFILLLSWAHWSMGAFVPQEFHAFSSRLSSRYMVSSTSQTKIPETFPLARNTFPGLIEAALAEHFGSSASRVIQSLRFLEIGYEHVEFVGNQQTPPITNEDTSECYQKAHSFIPGLQAKQFWDTGNMDWAQKLKKGYKEIKREFTRVTCDTEELSKQGNNIWAGALTQDASSYGEGWRTLVLMDRGIWDPVNVNCFPVTAKAIKDSGAPVVEAFFASMSPKTDIKLHTDNTNFVVTSHLALDIPDNGENKCRLTIGDETRQWINGEILMFDTSIMHAAINESDKTRYILMLRLWHPDLTDVERQAIQFTWDCLQIPELVSIHPEERAKAERYVEDIRAFPEIKRSASGFGVNQYEKKKKKRK